jgi:hypothetical protein
MSANEFMGAERDAWSRLRQDIGAIVWCSFLSACLATMLFFAIFDPLYLQNDESPPIWLADRRTGYALGFFFFWLTSAVAAALTAWLVDSRSSSADRPDKS